MLLTHKSHSLQSHLAYVLALGLQLQKQNILNETEGCALITTQHLVNIFHTMACKLQGGSNTVVCNQHR